MYYFRENSMTEKPSQVHLQVNRNHTNSIILNTNMDMINQIIKDNPINQITLITHLNKKGIQTRIHLINSTIRLHQITLLMII